MRIKSVPASTNIRSAGKEWSKSTPWAAREAEGYAPIVGAGPNSTALHYDKLSRKIENGDIVVLDVERNIPESADITRTIPSNGKFTPRQLEIYNIVLGHRTPPWPPSARRGYGQKSSKSLHKISYDYINSPGKDLRGNPLGQYYIHGLGHNIGLTSMIPATTAKPLQPGWSSHGARRLHPRRKPRRPHRRRCSRHRNGYKLLANASPRDPAEIEK